MRKLVWGGVVACLLAGGFGVYCATHSRHDVPAPPVSSEEEQEPPVPSGNWTANNPTESVLPPVIDANEPIVVEGPATEPPPAPEFGGAALPGQGVRVVALGSQQPPRPDEEPGQEKKMPYVQEQKTVAWVGAQVWEALCRILTGSPAQTEEPPTSEEQSEPPVPQTAPPPVVDYHEHEHEMHCPRYDRCPVPYYPVPPPAAPESR